MRESGLLDLFLTICQSREVANGLGRKSLGELTILQLLDSNAVQTVILNGCQAIILASFLPR